MSLKKGQAGMPVLQLFAELHLTCRRTYIRFVFRRQRTSIRARAVGVLQLIKPPIETANRQQFLMRALLANLAMMQHDDLLCTLNSRKSMGHHDGSAVA